MPGTQLQGSVSTGLPSARVMTQLALPGSACVVWFLQAVRLAVTACVPWSLQTVRLVEPVSRQGATKPGRGQRVVASASTLRAYAREWAAWGLWAASAANRQAMSDPYELGITYDSALARRANMRTVRWGHGVAVHLATCPPAPLGERP